MPFFSLTFTAFFPASLSFYWFILAAYQLFNTQLLYVDVIRRRLKIGGYGKEKKVVNFTKAIFVE